MGGVPAAKKTKRPKNTFFGKLKKEKKNTKKNKVEFLLPRTRQTANSSATTVVVWGISSYCGSTKGPQTIVVKQHQKKRPQLLLGVHAQRTKDKKRALHPMDRSNKHICIEPVANTLLQTYGGMTPQHRCVCMSPVSTLTNNVGAEIKWMCPSKRVENRKNWGYHTH